MVTSDRLRLVKCKMIHFNNHTYLLLGSLNLKPCTDCQSEAPLDIEIVRQDLNCNWDMIEPFVEGKPGGGRGAVKEIFR